MTLSLLDLSATKIPAQIQANLIAYMRLFAGLPGVITHDTDDLYWFICNKPAPGNVILRTRWSEADVEKQIDDLIAKIGQYIDHIDWWVYPGDQPRDLGRRLEARGMPGGRGGNWLWADLTSPGSIPIVPDGFHIEQVRDDQLMAEWTRATEAGFGGDESIFYDAYSRHGYGADAFSLHYIGYVGDTPVTSATLLDAGGSAAIYDVSTPPEFRQQGFGGAITHALMREIQRRGYRESWMWASNMAKSVYEKLGYVDAEFGLREHEWHKP